MNTPPPLPHPETSPSAKAHDSGLATCSMILGIIGVFTAGILSIPAVITGHLALGKIKRAAGTLSGSGRAIAGLITGYLGLALMPILIVAGYAGGNAAMKKARYLQARSATNSIDSSIYMFHTDYSMMPAMLEKIDTALDASLVRTLNGEDKILNTRGIRYLSLPEAVSKKGGLDPVAHKLYDPWGNGYQVIMDVHSSGSIVVTRGGKTETISGRKAVVFSLGADGIAGTTDDVTTW